uniref:Uncharacterized protein n=2 Tax=Acrobeloides nanus TaxID=290746 RepID=A0A914DFJ5_9BILA
MDMRKALRILSIANPDIAILMQHEPSLIGVDIEYSTSFSLMFIVFLGTYLSIVLVILTFICILYFVRSHQVKKSLSAQTRKTYNMLFRVLTIQLSTLGMVFVIPCFAVYAIQVLQLQHISGTAIIILVPFSFHHTMDFICLMYFVTPFRVFIAKKFKEVKKSLTCNAKQSKTSVVSIVTIQVSSQNRITK